MTNAELVILTLLVEQPRHGYEIEQVIEERGMREWTEIGFSSIYYLLAKLEKAGLVRGENAPPAGRGPGRKVYGPTPAGREALREATIQALETPHRSYPPILLGIANMASITTEEAIEALEKHRGELQARLANILARRLHPKPEIVDSMFDFSDAMVNAELEWISGFIQDLKGETVYRDLHSS